MSVNFDENSFGSHSFISEYDPNPLLSLSKRKRRVSTTIPTEDKSQKPLATVPVHTQVLPQQLPSNAITEQDSTISTEGHKERKRLKKKKREKLRQKLLRQDKKKKKKHKCSDIENCKHRKHHKKHRKHKKHHEKNKEERLENKNIQNQLEQPEPPPNDEEDDEEMADEQNEIVTTSEYSNELDAADNYNDDIPNPEDEVTMDDIVEATKTKVIIVYLVVVCPIGSINEI